MLGRDPLANSEPVALANAKRQKDPDLTAQSSPVYPFANSSIIQALRQQGEAWVQIAPYGDAPHYEKEGAKWIKRIQRFTQEDAETIISNFKSPLSLGLRIMGIPWYVGHPDEEKNMGKGMDDAARGRIRKLEAREDGLWGLVHFNRKGKVAVANEEYHGHSPYWHCVKADGYWRPRYLISVGFTNSPNLNVFPVMEGAIQNESRREAGQDEPETEKMNPNIRDTIILLGLAPRGASDDAVETSVDKLANSVSRLITERDEFKVKAEQAKGDLEKAEGERAALANERKAIAELVIGHAVEEGRITPAEQESELEALANSAGAAFAEKVKEIMGTEPKIKTRSTTGNLRPGAGVEDKRPLRELANEMVRNGDAPSYEVAFMRLPEKYPHRFPDKD